MPITTRCTCGKSITGTCHPDIEGCKQLFLTNADNHYKMEEKKCNCNEPYDAEYFQGGYPYCPVHDKPKESNMAIIGHGEPKHHPSSSYQNLFDYLTKEHGLTLLQSQMNDLISVVHKFHPADVILLPANDAVQNWFEENIDKECSASSAVYKFRLWLESLQGTRQTGAVWVKAELKPEHNVGVLVFIPGEDNHITSGMWDISNEWVLLDEYRTPEEEVTHWMPLPAFPEGYTWNEIPGELIDALKKVAKEELGKMESPAAGREEVDDPQEIWDEFSEYIGNDIDDCQNVAGSSIMTEASFKKAFAKFKQPKNP